MKKFFLLATLIYIVGFTTAILLKNSFLIVKINSLSIDYTNSSNKSTKDLFCDILKNNTTVYFASISGFMTLGLFTVISTFYNGFVLGYLIVTLNRLSENSVDFLPRILPHSIEIIGFVFASALGFYLTNFLCQQYFLKTKPKFEYKTVCLLFITGYLIILLSAFIESHVSAT
jgi:uncharacterized membrane protein SpoIIM required for sporulation